MPGVTTSGFLPKTIDDVRTSLNSLWRTVFGPEVNIDPRARHGQMIGGFAGQLAEAWKIGESIAGFFANPSGILLDYLSQLTGTIRKDATKSQITLTLTGAPATVVALGKIANVNGTTGQFATKAAATLASITAWSTGATVTAGQRLRANGNVYQASTGGTTAGSGAGPAGTGAGIIDNTVVWFFLGAGAAAVDVAAEATVAGPLQGYSGTVTIVSTPVSGWSGVYNVLDALPGTVAEMDPGLRVRRAQEVAAQGTSPLDDLRAELLNLTGVTFARVFENTTDASVDGTAAHTVECLVEGGTDAAVAQIIFASKAGGVGTSGNTSQTVADSESISHTVNFSRVEDIDVWVAASLLEDETYPANGDDQVKDAVVAYGLEITPGVNVYSAQVSAAVLDKDDDGVQRIPGIATVTSLLLGTTSTPIATSIVLTVRQRAVFDTSRITIAVA